MRLKSVIGSVAALMVTASAFGQGTITNGNATYTFNAGNTGSADLLLNGAGFTDQFSTNQWAFRLGGSTGQKRLSMGTPTSTATGGAVGVTSQTYVGNVSTLNWSQSGVNFTLTSTLIDGAVLEQGSLAQNMFITNTTGQDVTLALFNYMDMDLSRLTAAGSIPGGSTSFSNDLAVINGSGDVQTITDVALGTQAIWSAPNADAWEIRAFSTLGSAIRSATTYNLANTGSPFGGTVGADYTGAFQWNLTIPAGQSVSVNSNLLFTGVPAPGAMALLALAGICGTRRRRA